MRNVTVPPLHASKLERDALCETHGREAAAPIHGAQPQLSEEDSVSPCAAVGRRVLSSVEIDTARERTGRTGPAPPVDAPDGAGGGAGGELSPGARAGGTLVDGHGTRDALQRHSACSRDLLWGSSVAPWISTNTLVIPLMR